MAMYIGRMPMTSSATKIATNVTAKSCGVEGLRAAKRRPGRLRADVGRGGRSGGGRVGEVAVLVQAQSFPVPQIGEQPGTRDDAFEVVSGYHRQERQIALRQQPQRPLY